jgi:uncharacterized membrane protein
MNKEEFLSAVSQYYDEFNSLTDKASFYDYEKSFVDLWQRMGKDCMEKQLNERSVTENRRKKKL